MEIKFFYIYFFVLIITNFSRSEEKITTSPLINIDEIKPSFEELDDKNESLLLIKN